VTGASAPVLVVTDRRFWLRSIGSEQRIASLLLHLARRGESVTVAYLGRIGASERDGLERFCATAPRLTVRSRGTDLLGGLQDGLAALVGSLRAVPRPRDTSGRRANPLLRERSPARRQLVQALLREIAPRAVIVEFTRLTSTVHPRDPARTEATAYLIDTHDLLHQRAPRFRANGLVSALEVDVREETEAFATYDAILAIHAGDGGTIRTLVPEKTVLVVPHGIELPVPVPGFVPGPRPIRLGFLGGRDPSNHAGLHWFLDHVWSKLAARFAERVELVVAGQVGATWTRTEKGIRLVGAVESIGEFWPAIDIAINPVRFGSGLKIKNVEALAYARSLVTSPIGAEGLESAAPAGLCIAETPEEWLAILSRFLEDPARIEQTGRVGRAYAERHFPPTAAFSELDAFLDGLAPVRSPGH
jgi:glycosyltransferase involved in cell wall biosynthesis